MANSSVQLRNGVAASTLLRLCPSRHSIHPMSQQCKEASCLIHTTCHLRLDCCTHIQCMWCSVVELELSLLPPPLYICINRTEITGRGITSTPLVGGKQNLTSSATPSRPGSLPLHPPTLVVPSLPGSVQLAGRPRRSECGCMGACQSTSEHSQLHHLM